MVIFFESGHHRNSVDKEKFLIRAHGGESVLSVLSVLQGGWAVWDALFGGVHGMKYAYFFVS